MATVKLLDLELLNLAQWLMTTSWILNTDLAHTRCGLAGPVTHWDIVILTIFHRLFGRMACLCQLTQSFFYEGQNIWAIIRAICHLTRNFISLFVFYFLTCSELYILSHFNMHRALHYHIVSCSLTDWQRCLQGGTGRRPCNVYTDWLRRRISLTSRVTISSASWRIFCALDAQKCARSWGSTPNPAVGAYSTSQTCSWWWGAHFPLPKTQPPLSAPSFLHFRPQAFEPCSFGRDDSCSFGGSMPLLIGHVRNTNLLVLCVVTIRVRSIQDYYIATWC